MKLVQNFMLFLPVPLASPLGEEGVHSCAGTITVTPATTQGLYENVAFGVCDSESHRPCSSLESPQLDPTALAFALANGLFP